MPVHLGGGPVRGSGGGLQPTSSANKPGGLASGMAYRGKNNKKGLTALSCEQHKNRLLSPAGDAISCRMLLCVFFCTSLPPFSPRKKASLRVFFNLTNPKFLVKFLVIFAAGGQNRRGWQPLFGRCSKKIILKKRCQRSTSNRCRERFQSITAIWRRPMTVCRPRCGSR